MTLPREFASSSAAGVRRLARSAFDRLELAVAASGFGAASALAAVAGVGRMRALLSGRWPSAGEVAALLGTGRLASRRIALGIAANEARNRLVVRRTAGSTLAPFAPLVRCEGAAPAGELAGPLVLVTAHVGALYLLSAGLDRFWSERLVLRWSELHRTARGQENALTSGPVLARTEALRRGLESLRAGRAVVTALEGPHGSAEPGRLFGRRLDLGRGAFALARLAEVRLVPVAAVWERSRVRVSVGPPIEPSAGAAGETSRWFEALLRRSPCQVSLGLLRRLLENPACPLSGEDARGV